MKKTLFFVTFAAITILVIAYALLKNESKSSVNSAPYSSAKKENPKYVVNGCITFEAAIDEYNKILDDASRQESQQNQDAAFLNSLEGFLQSPKFKELEKATLINNECGGQSLALMFSIYSQLKLKNEERIILSRLLDFANANNSSAIRTLCVFDDMEIPIDKKIYFCEYVFNNSNNPIFKNTKSIAAILLTAYYRDSRQIDKLAALCEKNSSSNENKKRCAENFSMVASILEGENKYDQAFRAYDKAAIYDDSGLAQSSMADMYLNGKGTPQNFSMAVYWYQETLKKNISDYWRASILNDMGVAYGGLLNYVAAIQCYKMAAEMGLSTSMLNLAKNYAAGEGALVNNKQAYAWSSVAIAKGLSTENEQAGARLFNNWQKNILIAEDHTGAALEQAKYLAQQYYNIYVLHEQPATQNSLSFSEKIKKVVHIFTD